MFASAGKEGAGGKVGWNGNLPCLGCRSWLTKVDNGEFGVQRRLDLKATRRDAIRML